MKRIEEQLKAENAKEMEEFDEITESKSFLDDKVDESIDSLDSDNSTLTCLPKFIRQRKNKFVSRLSEIINTPVYEFSQNLFSLFNVLCIVIL